MGDYEYILDRQFAETAGFGFGNIYLFTLWFGANEEGFDNVPSKSIVLNKANLFERVGISNKVKLSEESVILYEPYDVKNDPHRKNSSISFRETSIGIEKCKTKEIKIGNMLYLHNYSQHYPAPDGAEGRYENCDLAAYVFDRPYAQIRSYDDFKQSLLGLCYTRSNECTLNFNNEDISIDDYNIKMKYIKYYYDIKNILVNEAIIRVH